MKIFNKIIWSNKEPQNKNDIWFDGRILRVYKEVDWQPIVLDSETADIINELLEDFQEKLIPGDNITIKGNVISSTGGTKDVYVGTEEPTEEGIKIWINPKLQGKLPVTIENSLSDSSTNLVQNKVIKRAIDSKQDNLYSGTNIKTINNQEVLGNGNLETRIYNSNITNTDATVIQDYGDIKAGTSITELNGLTYNELFDKILFASMYPTFVHPSIQIKLSGFSTFVEVGSTAPKASDFIVSFNRGGIYLGDNFQNYRSGELNEGESFFFIDNDEDNTKLPSTIKGGNTIYKYKAIYEEGPQPYDNKGMAYGFPLPAGSVVSSGITITGIYPWYATTEGATEDNLIKQPLKGTNTYSNEFVLQSAALCPQIIETPEEITGIKVKDPISGNYIESSLVTYTKTEVLKDINGNEKTYYQYRYNTDEYGFRGEVSLKIKF